jgi:hypothetical protein
MKHLDRDMEDNYNHMKLTVTVLMKWHYKECFTLVQFIRNQNHHFQVVLVRIRMLVEFIYKYSRIFLAPLSPRR